MAKTSIDPLAWKGYFERFALPLLQRDRFFIAMTLAILVAGLEGVALVSLIPLHTVKPYIIKLNQTGQVVSAGPVGQEHKPSSAEVTYWLGQFVSYLYTVEPGVVKNNVINAYYMTRGAAVGQFTRFMKQHNPVHRLSNNPSLRTTVKITGVSEIARDTAFVTANVTNHLTGVEKPIAFTVSYTIKLPKTVKQALRNPIGLHVTNFVVQGN